MKKVAIIILIIFLILLVRNGIVSIKDKLKNTTTEQELKKSLEEEKRKNAFLKEMLLYVKTDEFVEEEAREKLEMVKSDEYAIIALPENFDSTDKDQDDTRSNLQKWLDMLF